MTENIAILTSGMGLGTYIPAITIQKNLKSSGINSNLFVYESLFTKRAIENYENYKVLFHHDMRATIAGHKMPVKNETSALDHDLYENLLNEWHEKNIDKFLVLSGHWIHILSTYSEEKYITVECLRLDCNDTPSWKSFKQQDNPSYHTTWLFDMKGGNLQYKITVDSEVVDFAHREDFFYLHGGGWGMGDYSKKITELNKNLCVTLYQQEDIDNMIIKDNLKYYYLDALWHPWHKDKKGEYTYPPKYLVDLQTKKMILCEKGNLAYEITADALGIISKPGGGTIVDSISSATPMIFLPHISEHERVNAQVFTDKNLAISFEEWENSGFQKQILLDIHLRLKEQANKAIEYTEYLKSIF